MAIPLSEQLESLVERTYTRNGKTFTVAKVMTTKEAVKIYTLEGDVFEKHLDQMPGFIRSLNEVETGVSTKAAPAEQLSPANHTALEKMQLALLDSIDRVQKNPHYVEQAAQISKLVQTGINLARLELDARKLAR